jgi:hypothetical protein
MHIQTMKQINLFFLEETGVARESHQDLSQAK